MNNELKQAIAATEPYFGTGAERFILRQITAHLGITAEQFDASKFQELAQWVELSASLLLDKTKAKELADSIRSLH